MSAMWKGGAEGRGEARHPWVWLALGAGLLLVSNGRWILAPAAWLALPGWLLFVDGTPARRGLPIAFAAWVAVFLVAWHGIVPAPGLLYVAITGTYAVVYFVPIVLHRSFTRRLGPVAATLVFPFAWTGVEMVFQRWITPYGSWLSIAYSQSAGPLLQVAALAGTAGITFLITWLGGALAVALDRRTVAVRPSGLVAWATVLVVALAFGEARLLHAGSGPPPIRTASILPNAQLTAALDEAMAGVSLDQPLDTARRDEVVRTSEKLDDDLLARSAREAVAGARIVAWSETAGRVLASGEDSLLERARRLAAQHGVALLVAYGVWTPGAHPPLRNEVVAIGPDGHQAWVYEKSHPIVGSESFVVSAGDGRLKVLESEGVRIAAVICHDLDFPGLLRRAAAEKADLVVGPSDDWRLITDVHARMARMRAVESGFSLLRPTHGGRTLAVDAWGRIHASVDRPDDAVVAELPVGRVTTLYGVVGEWLGWVSLAGLLVLVLGAFRRERRRHSYFGYGELSK